LFLSRILYILLLLCGRKGIIEMKKSPLLICLSVICAISLFAGAGCGQNAAPQGGGQLSIQSLSPVQNQTTPGGTVVVVSAIVNPENYPLNYKWSASGGGFGGSGASNTWQAPSQPGVYEIKLVVDDGKGNSAQAKTSISVSSNRAPAITGLTADPVNVNLGGHTTLKCVANDPEGDIVHYSWNPAEGSISGTGQQVTWNAPSRAGEFGITCVVSDGKGAETKQVIKVIVGPVNADIVINIVKQESGTVSSTGDKDITRYRAGDDANGITYRAFISYDIFSLNKTNVRIAKLKFGPAKITGDPFNNLEGLRFWQVNYGEGLPDYNITGNNIYAAGGLLKSSPFELDITPEIKSLITAGASRYQMEALFYKATSSNGAIDNIEWPDIQLMVSFNP
jgi:hypothetical protein